MAKAFDVSRGFEVDTSGTLCRGLQAFYNLSDVNDFWNSYDLTNNNSATFVTGKIGNAVNTARASSQSLTIANALGINGGNISMSVFFKTPSPLPASGEYHMIVAQEAAGTDTKYWIALQNNGGTQTWNFMRTKRGIADQGVTSTPTISADTWYHLVLTYNGTSVEGFVDGTSQGTAAASGNGNDGFADQFAIGRWGSEALHYASGTMDLVGVWNKVLSSTEISDLYNSGNGNALVTSGYAKASLEVGLISWWNLEDTNDEYSTNNLTNTGSVAFNAGKIANAADMGASNSSKYLSITSALGITGGAVSVSCFLNVTTAPGTGTVQTFFALQDEYLFTVLIAG